MTPKSQTRNVDVDKLKKQLIAFGKKKGHISAAELRELIPADLIDPSELKQWKSELVAEGVRVLTAEEARAIRSSPKAARGSTSRGRGTKKGREVDEATRTNDPVRMYLRKMGSVSLLTREGEVEIAKRIEEGELKVFEIALHSPVSAPYVLEMSERIKRGQQRVKDVIIVSNPSENNSPSHKKQPPFNQEAALENLHRQIEKIRRTQKDMERISEQVSDLELGVEQRHSLTLAKREMRATVVESIRALRLSRRPVDGIVLEIRSLIARVNRAERDLGQCERRAGMDLAELRTMFKDHRLSEEEE
ncbi:MAG: sigma-70 factor domain-containing protein, partial [Nannocystaceae bacterium]